MSENSGELEVKFRKSVHVIQINGKTLTKTTHQLTHLTSDGKPLYEENVTVQAIDGRKVERYEEIKEGNKNKTTSCIGFDENELVNFDEEWNALWDPTLSGISP